MNILSKVRRFGQKHLSGGDDFREAKGEQSSLGEHASRAAVGGLAVGVVGAGIGAGIGAMVARGREIDAYESSIDPTTVELSWQEPIFDEQVIGRIPEDERIRPGFFTRVGWNGKPTRVNPDTEPVWSNNPVLDGSGRATMREVSEVFSGYGKANIEWEQRSVFNTELEGYDRKVTSRYEDQLWCESNWAPPEDQDLVEWCVKYRPKTSKHNVGTYETPEVKFERPESVTERVAKATASGALKGAGIGLLSGVVTGVIGSVLLRSTESS